MSDAFLCDFVFRTRSGTAGSDRAVAIYASFVLAGMRRSIRNRRSRTADPRSQHAPNDARKVEPHARVITTMDPVGISFRV